MTFWKVWCPSSPPSLAANTTLLGVLETTSIALFLTTGSYKTASADSSGPVSDSTSSSG